MLNKLFLIVTIVLSLVCNNDVFGQTENVSLTICSNIPRKIGVDSIPDLTYTWTPQTALTSPNSSWSFLSLPSNPLSTPYTYQLQVKDSLGNTVVTYIYTIHVSGVNGFGFDLGSASMCSGTTVSFPRPFYIPITTMPSPPDNFSYNAGDDSFLFSPDDTTLYSFTLIDTPSCFVNLITYQVNVQARDSVYLSSPEELFCLNELQVVQLDFDPAGGLFSGAGMNQSGQFNVQAAGSGTHVIAYTINPQNCPSTALVTVEVIGENNVFIDEFPNYCRVDSVFILTQGNPAGGTYLIDGVIATSINPSLLSAGEHTLTYSYVTTAECTFEKSVLFYIISLPQTPVVESLPSTLVCEGDTVVLSSSFFPRYLWSTGDTTRSISVVTGGTYAMQFLSNTGCRSLRESVDIIIAEPFAIDLIPVVFPNGYNLSAFEANDGEVDLFISGGYSPFEIVWQNQPNSGSNFDSLSPQTYRVEVTDLAGCSANDTIEITGPPYVPPVIEPVPNDGPLLFPNAFTPNGDGFNESFVIKGLSPKYDKNEISVWDIKRSLVYSKKNYDNTWTGLDMKGNQLSPGTYFVVFKSDSGSTVVKRFVDIQYE